MLTLNRNEISIALIIVALVAGFAFVLHPFICLNTGYTFCMFVACAFIPVFFTLSAIFNWSSSNF